MFSLHEALGVSRERGKELSAMLGGLLREPDQNMEAVCEKLAGDYDPESIMVGAYIGLAILENDDRVVPKGYRVAVSASAVLEPEAAD